MNNKPDKFGIKFWLLVDTNSKYLLNGKPYLGKDDNRPDNLKIGEHIVLDLLKPYHKSGLTIITDNFFTSLELAKRLKKKNMKLVGTIRANRRELPPECTKISKSDSLYKSKHFQHQGILLAIYKCKRDKNVYLLSSKHQFVNISKKGNPKKKSNIIKFYNDNKCGVDVIDQMAKKWSTKASSRRWPMQVFYNVLDLAGINSWILYKIVTGCNISRRMYLRKLGEELCNSMSNIYVKPCDRNLNQFLSTVSNSLKTVSNKRKRCNITKCDNKTNQLCERCNIFCCGTHLKRYCLNCVGKNNSQDLEIS